MTSAPPTCRYNPRQADRPRRGRSSRTPSALPRAKLVREPELAVTGLEHIRGLLRAKGDPGAETARLLLFGGAGFSDALVECAAKDPSVQLIGLDRLYCVS